LPRHRLIVNADDFGLATNVNQAILTAFHAGLVSSTTIMATMPGFEEASALAHEHGLLQHVGMHIVLTEGAPLTDPIRSMRRFCDASGAFFHWSVGDRALHFDAQQRRAVAGEIRAQVEKCRSRGLPLTHLDSHHQVHAYPALTTIVGRLAREAGIAAVRIAENCGAGRTALSRARAAYVNGQLRAHRLARTRYFGDYAAHGDLQASGRAAASFELVTHPTLAPDGRLTDALHAGSRFEQLVRDVAGPAQAVSFTDAAYGGVRR